MELPPSDVDYLLLAGRLNQLSLLPFLAFLWTLARVAPPRLSRVWVVGYAGFLIVAIPAGMWCRSELGTSMSNVDWVHGPCEALLSAANLSIVLALRASIREAAAAGGDTSATPAGPPAVLHSEEAAPVPPPPAASHPNRTAPHTLPRACGAGLPRRQPLPGSRRHMLPMQRRTPHACAARLSL
jgi:hypothetical protein